MTDSSITKSSEVISRMRQEIQGLVKCANWICNLIGQLDRGYTNVRPHPCTSKFLGFWMTRNMSLQIPYTGMLLGYTTECN